VTSHQAEFTERLLAKHSPEGCRIEPMPYKTKHQLEPWTGDAASEAEYFHYMGVIGDLVRRASTLRCGFQTSLASRIALARTTSRRSGTCYGT